MKRLLQRLGWWLIYKGANYGDPIEVTTGRGKESPRGYMRWSWNSPDSPTMEGMPPIFFLAIDSLQRGREIAFHMSPRQAWMFCQYGLDGLAKQGEEFGYDPEDPIDYDVRVHAPIRYPEAA
jgi:hypothetical protein